MVEELAALPVNILVWSTGLSALTTYCYVRSACYMLSHMSSTVNP